MRISDWSSDVCSSDLHHTSYWKPFSNASFRSATTSEGAEKILSTFAWREEAFFGLSGIPRAAASARKSGSLMRSPKAWLRASKRSSESSGGAIRARRSEEHTSELQSLMRISYAVFCLKTKITIDHR